MNEIVIRRKTTYVTKFLAVALLFSVSAGLIGLLSGSRDISYVPAAASDRTGAPVVVIDPGHGGEDGGASSAEGISEKDINLTISKLCEIVLAAGGLDVRLTRADDRLIYDMYGDLDDYAGKKKTYDLRNRVRFAKEADADVFFSVHLNKFTQPQYSGLQVYYSPNDPRSADYARSVKETVRDNLQPENEREIKRASSSIFILSSLDIPAILVECGFLSNPEEAERLADPSYERSLAICIGAAIQNCLASNDEISRRP